MDNVQLKISQLDWLYIALIGLLFGLSIASIFYFLAPNLHYVSTIYFALGSSTLIALFSSLFITLSNNYILPNIDQIFWYFISFIFSFASGFLGFVLSFFVSSYFSFPVAEQIEPWWIELSAIIGFLTFLIGLMLHQFIAMKYRQEATNTQYTESRLRALENELNPHFLFNALNSMSELVYLDQKKAESSILNLSSFLRHAINKESIIPLGLELKMVKNYVEIENIRFNDRIKLHIKIDENIEEIQVPKFSIQLLVENAIKHGYMQKTLNIHIRASKKTILVHNDGKITQKVIYGTGLQNLKNRLELLNIGKLTHEVMSTKMGFCIFLKGSA
jgi:sensor histidine kinase YesM